MKFLNIHTHHAARLSDELAVLNKHELFLSEEKGLFSCGLHPWYLDENRLLDSWNELRTAVQSDQVVAVGECGLDRVCETAWELQVQWFEKQILLANEIKKPLIIHCVRAHAEVMNLLERTGNKMPVIFHGFNKKESIAEQIIDRGYYLSFGEALQKDEIRQVLQKIPMNRFFLEKDDSNFTIEKIYAFAATAKACEVEKMKQQIWSNAQEVFGTKADIWKI